MSASHQQIHSTPLLIDLQSDSPLHYLLHLAQYESQKLKTLLLSFLEDDLWVDYLLVSHVSLYRGSLFLLNLLQ